MEKLKDMSRSERLFRLACLIVGVVLLALNIYRIFAVSITHDETGYRVADSYLDLMRNDFASANNHILHSLFRKFFVETFSDNLFFLRLDSLLAQVCFLYLTSRLAVLVFGSNTWRFLFFVIINLVSPMIFEFWGLSRGYALGLMFMTASIYFLLKYLHSSVLRTLYIALFAGVLSVYSNFSFINYYMSLITSVAMLTLLFARGHIHVPFWKEILAIGMSSAVLALLIVTPLVNVYGNGELQFLGHSGFINDTIKSLVTEAVLYKTEPQALVKGLIWFVILSTWLSGLFWLREFVIKRNTNEKTELKWGIALYLLLIVACVSVIMQHVLFGISYLIDRTGLFFILLFTFHFCYLLHYLLGGKRSFGVLVPVAIAILLLANFRTKVLRTHTRLWWYAHQDMDILKRIKEDWGNKPGKIRLWVTWKSAPSFKYNTIHYYKGEFEEVSLHHDLLPQDTTFDYCLVQSSEVESTPPTYLRDSDYTGGAMVLFRNRNN